MDPPSGTQSLSLAASGAASNLRASLKYMIERLFPADYSDSQAFPWTAPMVAAWLCILGLTPYLDKFMDNGVDGVTLLSLSKSQFVRCLGIHNQNHAQSLHSGLKLLKNVKVDYSHWEWSCEAVEKWLGQRGLRCISKVFRENAVHGGVLFSFTKSSLKTFLSRLPSFDFELFSPLVFKSLWLCIVRARKTGTSILVPEKYVEDWGEKELELWLSSINLLHIFPKFRSHGLNGTVLVKLTKNDLSNVMGATELQTKVLRRHIKFLRQYVRNGNENAGELLSRNGATGKPKNGPFMARMATTFSDSESTDSILTT